MTVPSLFIGLIIEITRLLLEFLKCENLGMRIFKYSHRGSFGAMTLGQGRGLDLLEEFP